MEDNIVSIETVRQPKWQPEEIELLYATFREYPPLRNGDYSLLFRMIGQVLPHRTLSGALYKIRDGQIEQKIPYYGSLPFSTARNKDKTNMEYITGKLKEWKEEQAKKAAEEKKHENTSFQQLEYLLLTQNEILDQIYTELQNIRGFIAGIYRRAIGEDGHYILVEPMQYADEANTPNPMAKFP